MTQEEIQAISVPIYEYLKAKAQLVQMGTSTGLLFKAETFYSAIVSACKNAPPKIVYVKSKSESPDVDKPEKLDSTVADTVDALIGLGFSKSEAMSAAQKSQGTTLEERISNSLKELS